MKCPRCGSDDTGDARFCSNCGFDVSDVLAHSLVQRMVGAAKLDVQMFEEVEADTSATRQALIVVIVVALATGLSAAIGQGLAVLIPVVLFGLISWAVWAFIIYLIGTKLLPTSDTECDWGQVARTTGFAQTPGLLKIFGVVPIVGVPIAILAEIWRLVATVIAIRQALDYSSTLRAVAVVVLGFIPYIFVMSFALSLIGGI
jgi:hypothetical protein